MIKVLKVDCIIQIGRGVMGCLDWSKANRAIAGQTLKAIAKYETTLKIINLEKIKIGSCNAS